MLYVKKYIMISLPLFITACLWAAVIWWILIRIYLSNSANSLKKQINHLTELDSKLKIEQDSIHSQRQSLHRDAESIIESAREKAKQADDFLQSARKQAVDVIKSAEWEAWNIKKFAQEETEKMMTKLDHMQIKIEEKDKKLEEKLEWLENMKSNLQQEQEKIHLIRQEQIDKLSQIAWLNRDEAKTQLFDNIEREYSDQVTNVLTKYKWLLEQDIENECINLISKSLPRIASNSVSEFTVTTVDIPSEDIKWRLIGREGRNVAIFERTTGVELLIDDTPGIVRLSSYDHEKRFIAVELIRRLIKDGRISPIYIQKLYEEVAWDFEQLMIEKWKEALNYLWLPPQHPEITQIIWMFTLRYSYGQNLYEHSLEVAKLSEIMANEMWLDAELAKKAWLLHDIWKIVAQQWESHTQLWAQLLKKYWYDEVTVNTALAHHHDVPLTSAIWWIVTAADAMSATRPWARFNSKEFFIKKMSKLEELISWVAWVEKTYIMQAWREIMVFVNPTIIDDLWLQKLVKTIATTVEAELDYPWMIRVVATRETKVVDYLR